MSGTAPTAVIAAAMALIGNAAWPRYAGGFLN